ncbi:plexin domain-containing protein 1 isoform X1 [Dermacentor albipictus]|uniref:plexin domain-containing protein 1 isoform X1 n=2 Tax=Dermacentor albipictus TaxID=60249 RepID=UPI0031FDC4F8
MASRVCTVLRSSMGIITISSLCVLLIVETSAVHYDVSGGGAAEMSRENIVPLHRVRRGSGAPEVTKKPTLDNKKMPTKAPFVKTPELSKKESSVVEGMVPATVPAQAAGAPLTTAVPQPAPQQHLMHNATTKSPAVPPSAPAVPAVVPASAEAGNVSTTTQVTPLVTSFLSEEELESLVESGNVTLPPGYQNQTDHHDYYNTTFYMDPATVRSLWTDMDALPSEHVITHDMLSVSHRRAATVNLSFDFPFYGHPVRNITIATGGFLFTGYMLHVWLAATQFIAPLMANFETISSNESSIKYVDNGTSFVVEWHQVVLQDKPNGGNYTFQAVLHKSGDIVFVYKDLPMAVTEIPDRSHPVKVGISDAYMFDRMVFFVKRKTIYEYHQVSKKSDVIRSNTAIVFTALPTCLGLKTCKECRSAQLSFSCSWCDAVQRCSSGIDRHRQSWLENQCDLEEKKNASQCSAAPRPTVPPPAVPTAPSSSATATVANASIAVANATSTIPEVVSIHTNDVHGDAAAHSASVMPSEGSSPSHAVSSGTVVAVIMILVLVVAVGVWLLYAYRNPQTPAGQLLIKYRPSQWRLHGEARYTAATSVHI